MRQLFIFIILLGLAAPARLTAHEGHDHSADLAAEPTGTGPITLTEETIRNLDVQTEEAQLAPLQATLAMPARIEGLPERHAKISPRAEGRVVEILAKLGDRVVKDQPLLRFQPLLVGNPEVVIKSPIDGQVVRQDASLGQMLTPETTLMEVADHREVLARAMSFERSELTQIQTGQPARVRLDVFGDRIFEGRVQRLDVGMARESRVFEVFVLLENPELMLRPNMQATVLLGLGEAQEVLSVPERALLGEMGNFFVFIRNGSAFERRAVVLGLRTGDRAEILEGVLPGEQVVTQGGYQIQFATAAPAAAEDEHGHEHGEEGGAEHSHAPPWAWAIGGFAAGALLFGWLLRRSPAPGLEN